MLDALNDVLVVVVGVTADKTQRTETLTTQTNDGSTHGLAQVEHVKRLVALAHRADPVGDDFCALRIFSRQYHKKSQKTDKYRE